ncbi:MAG: short-chain dehydrogenase [Chitinophagales bacterium]|nr:MAG: short-chain dehydrogenase [Chitinophagales bacterium]
MHIKEKFNLTGKVAIITGASKGIGRAIAEALGQCGARVVVSSRKQEAVDAVAAELKAQQIEALAVAAHMGQEEDIQRLASETRKHFGRIDILVNNAASNPVFGPIADTNPAAFDKIIGVNLRGPFLLSNEVYPDMRRQGGGSIIHISSVEGLTPSPGLGIYSVSKASLLMLTKAQAREWGSDGIRVNAICPGLIQTKFSRALWENADVLQHFLGKTALQRIGQPEDIAGLAVFLASDAAVYCTGSMFIADGGYLI